MQIGSVLQAIEDERAGNPGLHWFGRLTHADIALACGWRFVQDAHPGLLAAADYPALGRIVAEMERMAVFSEIYQPFIAPEPAASRQSD